MKKLLVVFFVAFASTAIYAAEVQQMVPYDAKFPASENTVTYRTWCFGSTSCRCKRAGGTVTANGGCTVNSEGIIIKDPRI